MYPSRLLKLTPGFACASRDGDIDDKHAQADEGLAASLSELLVQWGKDFIPQAPTLRRNGVRLNYPTPMP
jgi:hypothetical protein